MLNNYIKRVGHSFGVLRDKLAESGAELLIIVGGDQNEMFDSSNKACFMVYLGDTTWGHNATFGQPVSEEDIVRLKVDVETSQWLLNKLVTEEGFDVSFSSEQVNLGNPERGLPHAFIRPVAVAHAQPGHPDGDPVREYVRPAVAIGGALLRAGPGACAAAEGRPTPDRHLRLRRTLPTTPAGHAPAGWTRRWTAGSWTSSRLARGRPPRPCTPSTR